MKMFLALTFIATAPVHADWFWPFSSSKPQTAEDSTSASEAAGKKSPYSVNAAYEAYRESLSPTERVAHAAITQKYAEQEDIADQKRIAAAAGSL